MLAQQQQILIFLWRSLRLNLHRYQKFLFGMPKRAVSDCSVTPALNGAWRLAKQQKKGKGGGGAVAELQNSRRRKRGSFSSLRLIPTFFRK